MNIKEHLKAGNLFWWFGFPIINLVLILGPFWISQLTILEIKSWWRVPVFPFGVFDSYLYLYWFFAAVHGMAISKLSWFGMTLQGFRQLLPNELSIVEFWLLTRWIFSTMSLWFGAKLIKSISGLGTWQSRILALSFWFVFIGVLSYRPGIYSWYLPFILLGLFAAFKAIGDLDKNSILSAVGWSIVALGLNSIYPWFLFFVALWLVVWWTIWLMKKRIWLFALIAALGWVGAVIISVPLARWFFDPIRLQNLLQYQRIELGLSRMPFLSNTMLILILFPVLLFILSRVVCLDKNSLKRLEFIFSGWLVLFFSWFHTPFTGIYTMNDHFIMPILVFSWISLAVVLSTFKNVSKKLLFKVNKVYSVISFSIFLFSGIFFIFILKQPFQTNPLKFFSYSIHLSLWLALVVAAGIVFFGLRGLLSVKFKAVLLSGILLTSVILGAFGVRAILATQNSNLSDAQLFVPAINWIKSSTSNQDIAMCSDIRTAELISAHTGQLVLPAEAWLFNPQKEEEIVQTFETLAGAYDVNGAGETALWHSYVVHYRSTLCEIGPRAQMRRQFSILRFLGFGEDRAREIMGCPKDIIDLEWLRVSQAIEIYKVNDRALNELCPWIIVSEDKKNYWQIPDNYSKVYQDSFITILSSVRL